MLDRPPFSGGHSCRSYRRGPAPPSSVSRDARHSCSARSRAVDFGGVLGSRGPDGVLEAVHPLLRYGRARCGWDRAGIMEQPRTPLRTPPKRQTSVHRLGEERLLPESKRFYLRAARHSTNTEMRQLPGDLAAEERRHVRRAGNPTRLDTPSRCEDSASGRADRSADVPRENLRSSSGTTLAQPEEDDDATACGG